MGLGCTTGLAYGCVHLPGSLLNLVQVFIELNQQHPYLTPSPSQRLVDGAESSTPAIIWPFWWPGYRLIFPTILYIPTWTAFLIPRDSPSLVKPSAGSFVWVAESNWPNADKWAISLGNMEKCNYEPDFSPLYRDKTAGANRKWHYLPCGRGHRKVHSSERLRKGRRVGKRELPVSPQCSQLSGPPQFPKPSCMLTLGSARTPHFTLLKNSALFVRWDRFLSLATKKTVKAKCIFEENTGFTSYWKSNFLLWQK